ncbi:hypothetical protein [Chryseobacterium viscerum]|uniref:Uncharacterized protein n=1 Tax=Chryseobacterium viscerum TaxID=1037377 RepID=A0A316X3J3_9FLAO|nr:hypothetical protein [Chryseobacterium viscerum]PWN65818.1 hypothetical protein C1634_003535 [Chryseobacterium viscerum]
MSKKKLLIHEVFEKARKDFPAESTKNGWCKELVDHFEKKLKFIINEKTFVRYYDACIRDNSEPNIKDIKILNKLSEYVGYIDFTHFSNTFIKKEEKEKSTTVRIDVDDNDELFGRGIKINITQYFNLPEFMKKNGLGIAGILLIGSILLGNYNLPRGKDKKEGGIRLGLFNELEVDRNCMYWNGTEYKITSCEDRNPHRQVIPIDTIKLNYFKKVTRPDTLTLGNSLGKVWCSKYNNEVNFFTMDGVNPDNKKELKLATDHMILTYGKGE